MLVFLLINELFVGKHVFIIAFHCCRQFALTVFCLIHYTLCFVLKCDTNVFIMPLYSDSNEELADIHFVNGLVSGKSRKVVATF